MKNYINFRTKKKKVTIFYHLATSFLNIFLTMRDLSSDKSEVNLFGLHLTY